MEFYEEDDKLILQNIYDFNIKDILECGQVFRFEKLRPNTYNITAHSKVLTIQQIENKVIFYPMSIKEFEEIWIDYFDLNTNYETIKKVLSKDDPIMQEAIKFGSGIRLLNQERWECLISFIISQNNRIPTIKKVIENLSFNYGTKIQNGYAFPTLVQLDLDIEKIAFCKAGFRSKYILDAVNKVNSKDISMSYFNNQTTSDLRNTLMRIHGVGPKVADCTILFSCGRREVFPIDVWVKRVMQYFYFDNKETSVNEIQKFAKENWGEFAGFAQQYLFYYARETKIGV